MGAGSKFDAKIGELASFTNEAPSSDGASSWWTRRRVCGGRCRGGAIPPVRSWDAASFVERTTGYVFGSVSQGIAIAGENRRSVDRTVEAIRRSGQERELRLAGSVSFLEPNARLPAELALSRGDPTR